MPSDGEPYSEDTVNDASRCGGGPPPGEAAESQPHDRGQYPHKFWRGPSPEDRDGPPAPETWPLIGNAWPFFRRPFEYRNEVARKYGDIVDVSGLGRRAFLVSHPQDIERVLVTESERYCKPEYEKRFINQAFGNSLPLAEGEEWRRVRTLCQPVFEIGKIRGYGQSMAELAMDMVDGWANQEVLKVDWEMKRYTFMVFGRTMFDIEEDRIPDLHDDFEAIAAKTRPRYAIIPDWLPIRTNLRYKKALDRLENEIDSLISSRQGSEETGEDLLSLLVEANSRQDDRVSDTRIRDEVLSFLFAGHETTAMTLAFGLFLLATNSGDRQQLEAELDATLDDGLPGIEDLPALEFLDAVVSETLRLYPANHMVPREPVEDVHLGGYQIPKGSSVYCSQWVVHRDERWWDDPEEFHPKRWLQEEDRPDYAYFPFGGGPRNCIGSRFARLELKIALATMASEVSFRPVEPNQSLPPLAAGLSTHTTEPIELNITHRQ